jgi:hypothetical protein
MLSMELKRACVAAVRESNVALLRELMDGDPEIEAEPDYVSVLLMFAITENDRELMNFLVERGADIHYQDSPIHPEGLLNHAVDLEAYESMQWFLEQGAIINHKHQGVMRCLALTSAARHGNLDAVQLLVQYGADVKASWAGMNGLSQAIAAGHDHVVQFLKSVGATMPRDADEIDTNHSASEVVAHIEKNVGEIRREAIAEIVSDNLPITVHIADHDGQLLLFTDGMSARPMNIPEGQEEYQYAELVMVLRDDWPMSPAELECDENRWPIGWMRKIAHYPHDQDTWLRGQYSIIANDEPPQPLGPGTSLTSWLVVESPESYGKMKRKDGKTVVFYEMIPLYTEERDLERNEGLGALMERFGKYNISPWVHPGRVNTCLID